MLILWKRRRNSETSVNGDVYYWLCFEMSQNAHRGEVQGCVKQQQLQREGTGLSLGFGRDMGKSGTYQTSVV